MFKINNNSIVLSLLTLTILGLGLAVLPMKVHAAPTYVPGHYNTDGSYTYGDFYWPETKTVTTANNTSNSNSNTNSDNGSNAHSDYVNNIQNSNGYNGTNGNNPNNEEENVSTLASNAIFGSSSFAPSGIIQWILFAIIILILIIIVRKFFGGAERYHNKPLKYS